MVSSRLSNGLDPSGLRYFDELVGSTVSTKRSWTFESAVVSPQAIESFWPSTKTGAPGKVAPLTDPSGVTTRAKYHRIGALRSRCGSLARIGFPVSVRDPPTTHSFDAPLPIPVKVPSSSSMLSLLAWVSLIAGRVVIGPPRRAPG